MDETLEIVRRAFTEDEFDFDGTHFHLRGVRVRPRPVQVGGPPVWVAAMGEPGRGAPLVSMRTCCRRATGAPSSTRGGLRWRERGRDAADYRVGIARPFIVNDDPAASAASSSGVALAKVAAGGSGAIRVDAGLRDLAARAARRPIA